jgi:hypothetical protein
MKSAGISDISKGTLCKLSQFSGVPGLAFFAIGEVITCLALKWELTFGRAFLCVRRKAERQRASDAGCVSGFSRHSSLIRRKREMRKGNETETVAEMKRVFRV